MSKRDILKELKELDEFKNLSESKKVEYIFTMWHITFHPGKPVDDAQKEVFMQNDEILWSRLKADLNDVGDVSELLAKQLRLLPRQAEQLASEYFYLLGKRRPEYVSHEGYPTRSTYDKPFGTRISTGLKPIML